MRGLWILTQSGRTSENIHNRIPCILQMNSPIQSYGVTQLNQRPDKLNNPRNGNPLNYSVEDDSNFLRNADFLLAVPSKN